MDAMIPLIYAHLLILMGPAIALTVRMLWIYRKRDQEMARGELDVIYLPDQRSGSERMAA